MRSLFSLCALVFVASCSEQHAAKEALGERYDVIIVGSGAGGGPLAARLARGGKRVLLLEAGDDVGASLSYEVPARHALATEDASRAWSFYVQHHRDAALDREDSKYVEKEHGILYPRGSALGGSTAVNAMVTVLPSPSDWNRLAELTGDASFRATRMAPFYDRVKEWLSVELGEPSIAAGDPVVSGFLFAGAKATSDGTLGGRATSIAQLFGPDLNASLLHGEATGFFRLPYATSGGMRRGSRERIVDTVNEDFPLTVSTGSFVTRVLFDGTRAIGVEYRKGHALYAASAAHDPNAEYEIATAHGEEIVVAAGSFNTPQILMLSGVGDPDVLEPLGIETHVVRKGVGQNLQDRYEAGVVAELERPIALLERCRLGEDDDPCLDEWRGGKGAYTTPGFLATALVRSTPEVPLANLQIFAVPADARGYFPGYAEYSAKKKDRFSWLVLEGHTHGGPGFVRLESAEPSVRPHIQKNIFDRGATLDDPDLAAMVHGVRVVRSIHAEMRKANPEIAFREIWPGPDVESDEQIAAWVARETWGHHVCCTDKMGTVDDETAVVDSHFRVIGASHLRVVDASVFPEIPGTFIALPLYMLSEKAAETMLEDMR